jgi:hypothetical protein
MALLDLKTNLKSLKYGSDTPGGGNSGQPYQQVDINTADSGFNRFRMTKFDDGLVRGGVVGAANASIVDTFRIGKFLKDFPKGPLFIVKQIGLQLSNPRLESKKLNTSSPTSGQGFLSNVGNLIANTANKIVNAVGPTRIYNLGINTLAQVPVNAFGQHFDRHGLLPVQDDQTKYLAVAQFNNEGGGSPNNRLVGLKTRFRLGDMKSSINPQFFTNAQRRAAGQVTSGLFLQAGIITKPKPVGFLNANGELAIDRYVGGAQSVYGIGNTTILRKAFTEDATKIDVAFNQSKIWAGKSHLDQGPTEVQLIGNNILHPVSSNYTSSSFYKSGKELFDGKLLFKANLNLNIGSESDIQTSLLNGKSISKEVLAGQRIKSFLQVSNKQSSRLAENFFLEDFKPIISGSGSLNRQGLYDYNILNNSTPDVLINNTAKRTTSYTQINNEIRSGSFSRLSNYSGSAFASKQFDYNNIKYSPSGLNEIDKLPSYSGSTTWTPLNNTLGKLTASNDFGVSKQYFPSGSTIPFLRSEITYGGTLSSTIELTQKSNNTSSLINVNVGAIKNTTYNTYRRIIDSRQLRKSIYTDNGKIVNEFGIYGGSEKLVGDDVYFINNIEPNGVLPSSLEYPIYTNGSDIVKINIPWNKVSRELRVGSGRQDQINLTPIFNAPAGTIGDFIKIPGVGDREINDLVKFRIQALNGNNPTQADWMIFRAYITQFSDNTDAKWNAITYAGRGEEFYIYNGFTRKVQIGFKVAALSAEEMQPMYQKLNYLMGNVMPDYSDNNLMRGPFVKMTVGNWFDGQDGILNNVSYTVPQDSPWEIGLKVNDGVEPLILPHIIEVSMTFTPIGSQTKNANKVSSKSTTTSHIAQNYNKETQYIK